MDKDEKRIPIRGLPSFHGYAIIAGPRLNGRRKMSALKNVYEMSSIVGAGRDYIGIFEQCCSVCFV